MLLSSWPPHDYSLFLVMNHVLLGKVSDVAEAWTISYDRHERKSFLDASLPSDHGMKSIP